MKTKLVIFVLFFSPSLSAQYYYKDILGTKETSEIIKNYKNNHVNRVVLNSYDENNTKNDGFYVEQQFTSQGLRTVTRSGDEDATILTSYINEEGQVVKTVDSSNAIVSTTDYEYNEAGQLISISSTSSDLSGTFSQNEVHLWEYSGDRIAKMLRIKNKVDTTFVQFKLDDKGNVVEEQSMRKLVKADPVYYYYDAKNRLTDIVRFSTKARRLLPEYMFEYSANNQVIQKITVPSNNSEYLIWRYQYDTNGLKTKEAIYNKQKQLTGKIDYVYQKG
jgi:YD repeat-containing protein